MNVILGDHVDLITPFPNREIDRIWTWLKCYRNIVFHDQNTPESKETYIQNVKAVNTPNMCFGIIDKHNVTNAPTEAPLVGVISFDEIYPHNFLAHIATSRRCGKSYKLYGYSMVDEASKLALEYMFKTFPDLRRVTISAVATHAPVIGLVKRLGFQKEAHLRGWVTQNSEPIDVVQYYYSPQEAAPCQLQPLPQ